jgi:hypothetical protein
MNYSLYSLLTLNKRHEFFEIQNHLILIEARSFGGKKHSHKCKETSSSGAGKKTILSVLLRDFAGKNGNKQRIRSRG